MFKKFSPKEDIASSTSVKSSLQRTIRQKLLEQYPLLSLPALAPPPKAHNEDSDSEGESSEEELTKREMGGNKKLLEGKKAAKGRGGEKGGKKQNRKAEVEKIEVEEDAEGGELENNNLLEILWPKKLPLTLVKCRDHISILSISSTPLFFQHFDGPYYPTLHLLHSYPALLPRVQIDQGAIKFVLSGANIMCPGLTSPTADLPDIMPIGQPVAVYAYGKERALGIGLMTMSTEEIKKINKGCGVENICYLGDDLWSCDKL